MKLYHDITEVPPSGKGTALVIGNFDGVHLGHQALILSCVRWAREHDLDSSALTFNPHPIEVVRPGTRIPYLTTSSEKALCLEKLGISRLLNQRFTEELSRLTPNDFFNRFAVSGLRARAVFVGDDFRFGRDRSGGPDTLVSLGSASGIETFIQPEVAYREERVQSTSIRNLIREGRVAEARLLLGRPYFLTGTVVAGRREGRRMGIPTANLVVSPGKLVPGNGVYISKIRFGGECHLAVTNIGIRPTLGEGGNRTIESHLLDFDQDIYGECIRLELLDRIREERRFGSKDELLTQIRLDIESARQSTALD